MNRLYINKDLSTLKKLLALKAAVGGSAPQTETATGSLVTFDTTKALPLIECVAGIEPVQDLHGYDNPWPAGGGIQLIPYPYNDSLPVTKNGVAFTDVGNGRIHMQGTASATVYFNLYGNSATPIPAWVKPNTQYTLRPTTVSSKYFVQFILYGSTAYTAIGSTFTTPNDLSGYTGFAIVIGVYNGAEVNADIAPMLEYGATAHDFAPYSNICPISGWTGAKVYHSGEDTSNPEELDITFPTEAGTVYGGTLDVTNGVLTVDRAQIASYNGETLPGEWISDRDVYAAGTTPSIGAQVVYYLATPVTYQLTPQEITTLIGTNNVWADTGDITVKYYK